jgi:hypothetical protein
MPRTSKHSLLKETLAEVSQIPRPRRTRTLSPSENHLRVAYSLAITQQEARMLEELTKTPFRDNPPVPPPPGSQEQTQTKTRKTGRRPRSTR